MKKVISFLILLLIALQGTHAHQLFKVTDSCLAALLRVSSNEKSTTEVVVEKLLLPILGQRVLDGIQPAHQKIEWFSGINESRLILEISESETKPSIRLSADEKTRTLIIPRDYSLDQFLSSGAAYQYVLRWAMGSSLHPYMASPETSRRRVELGEPAFIPRPSQQEAMKAIDQWVKDNGKKFLAVASTGIGKTVLILHALRRKIETNKPQVHFVIEDQNLLTAQMTEDIQNAASSFPGKFAQYQWGGSEGSPKSLGDLLKDLDTTKKPIVVVTTIHSLKLKIENEIEKAGGSAEQVLASLRKHTGLIAWDEAHHAGAPEAEALIRSWVDPPDSNVQLLGTTATPANARTSITELFENIFRLGLDTAENFGEGRFSFDDVLRQLQLAIDSGELTPPKFYFIDPTKILPDGKTIYQQINGEGAGSRYVIQPSAYHPVIDKIAPFFDKHQSGIVVGRDINEIEALTKILNERYSKLPEGSKRTFAALHSDMSNKEQEAVVEKFKSGEINFIIKRFIGDEGQNFPQVSLYVDLSSSVGPRQLLQRLGRATRLTPGKTSADVVTMVDVNESEISSQLRLIQRIVSLERSSGLNVVQDPRADQSTDPITDLHKEGLKNIDEMVRQFWADTSGLVRSLDSFLTLQKRLPSLAATDETESRLATRTRWFLSRDYDGELWAKFNTQIQQQLTGSELDFRPITDVAASLESAPKNLDWNSSLGKRLKAAIRKEVDRSDNFIELLPSHLRQLAISALPKQERIREQLNLFVLENDRLPLLDAKDKSENELASNVYDALLHDDAKSFWQLLGESLQNLVVNSPLDGRPFENPLEKFRDFVKSVRNLHTYDWAGTSEAERLKKSLQLEFEKNPKKYLDWPDPLQQKVLIRALDPKEHAVKLLNAFYEKYSELPSMRFNFGTEILKLLEDAFKNDSILITKVDAPVRKAILKDPLMSKWATKVKVVKGKQLKFKVVDYTLGEFADDFFGFILGNKVPPGVLQKPSAKPKLKENKVPSTEVELMLKWRQLDSEGKIDELMAYMKRKYSPEQIREINQILSYNTYAALMRGSLFWRPTQKEIEAYFKQHGELPKAPENASLLANLKNQLKGYPMILDYYPPGVQKAVKATSWWATITEN